MIMALVNRKFSAGHLRWNPMVAEDSMMERLMHVIAHQRPSGTPPSPRVAVSVLHEATHRVFRRNDRATLFVYLLRRS